MANSPGTSYRAFLSYSHRDKRAAGRWHRFLESFQVDPLLVGRETKLGAVPEHLRPIFRDQLDHPSSGSLSEATKEALAQSAALILLASPHAAASKWVNEEVRLFRHLYPERPLVVILDAPGGAGFRACLPPALAFGLDAAGAVTEEPYTPIAADPRAGRDGLAEARAGAASVGADADEPRRCALRAWGAKAGGGGVAGGGGGV